MTTETAHPAEKMARGTRPGMTGSLLGAFTLAVGYPLLSLLGANAEFFVAHDTSPFDLVLLSTGLTVVVPLLIAGALRLIAALRPRVAAVVHGFLLGALMTGVTLPIFKRLLGLRSLPGGLIVAAAVLAGGGCVLAFARNEWLRRASRVAVVFPVLAAGLFLLASPASDLVFARGEGEAGGPAEIARPAPVVMVIMDELPVASLMTLNGEIDARLYPNFARLAQEGTWFRNATTVHDRTTRSIPAILTGVRPKAGSLPTNRQHPNSLFTLVGDDYRFNVVEPLTRLCPDSLCRPECPQTCAAVERPSFGARWRLLLSDMNTVYMHLLLPEDLARALPPIDDAWSHFSQRSATPEVSRDGSADDGHDAAQPGPDEPSPLAIALREPAASFRQFIASIEKTKRPTLNFLHVFLPHNPFRYLPSGQVLSDRRRAPKRWPEDDATVAQQYQRHLLQMQFVDRLVGELIERLEREAMYEDTLLVLTSDHGASFLAGHSRRDVTRDAIGDIGAVPLFVKRPHESRGGISDRPLETVDIVPTIADALGARVPWRVDGTSGFARTFPKRGRRIVGTQGDGSPGTGVPLQIRGDDKYDAVRRKYSFFEALDGSIDPLRLAPYGRLIGTRAGVGIPRDASVRVHLDDPRSYDRVDPGAPVLPSPVAGTVRGPSGRALYLAVAVRGVIRSTTRLTLAGGRAELAALVPPEGFGPGPNPLRFFVVTGSRGSLVEVSCENCR